MRLARKFQLPSRCSITTIAFVLSAVVGQKWTAGQTIINVPPDLAPASITGNTILNLFDGGSLGDGFQASSGAVVNIEGGVVGVDFTLSSATANIRGGTTGIRLRLNSGSLATISGGNVGGTFGVSSDSTLRVTGGHVGNILAVSGTVEINGGFIESAQPDGGDFTVAGGYLERLTTRGGMDVSITGGAVGQLSTIGIAPDIEVMGGSVGDNFYAASVVAHGFDFELNGIPIGGLDTIGSTVKVPLSDGALLTGTLADGTPFAYDRIERTSVVNGNHDFGPGITFVRSESPIGGTPMINVPIDPSPQGVRFGQTINVAEGGNLPNHFSAGHGSVVNIVGGKTGVNLEAVGAMISMSAGKMGARFDAFQGTVVKISGGTIGDQIDVLAGSRVELEGVDFRVNGVPVAGLTQVGDSVAVNLPSGSQFTGTLADGTPFAFTPIDATYQQQTRRIDGFFGDRFENGTLVLRKSTDPPVGPSLIHVPSEPSPLSIRANQELVLDDGGILDDDFVAGSGSAVSIRGGNVGSNFEAIGAVVNIEGGNIAEGFDAFHGTVLTMRGGNLGESAEALPGSIVNVFGGTIAHGFEAGGATVNVNGGDFQGAARFGGEAILDITGGSFQTIDADNGSTTNIRGGTYADFNALSGSTVHIFGTSFLLAGQPIPGLQTPGDSLILIARNNQRLDGIFRDGSAFRFPLDDAGFALPHYFDRNATLRLTVVAVPEPVSGPYLVVVGWILTLSRGKTRAAVTRHLVW